MKPTFDNKGLNVLYYTLFYASGIATAAALVAYKRGALSLAAVVAIGAVFVFFTLFHSGWTYLWKKENPPVIEESTAAAGVKEPAFDINEAKAAHTPKRVFLSLLTILILLIAWGWAWSQHVFDGVFFMDRPFSTYIGVTIIALGMLVAAFFPFLLDEDRYKNMAQVNLAIDRKIINAIFIALGLLSYAILKDMPDSTPWHTISLLVLGFVWLDFFMYYHDRISNVRNPQALIDKASDSLETQELKISRTIVGTIIEVVILILLVAAWFIKLSAQGISLTSIFQSPMTTLVFTLLAIAFLVVAYHPGWFFNKVKKYLTINQITSFVNTQRCWAVMFAMLAVLSSLQQDAHYDFAGKGMSIGLVILFIAVGWFFGGLDKRSEKKNK